MCGRSQSHGHGHTRALTHSGQTQSLCRGMRLPLSLRCRGDSASRLLACSAVEWTERLAGGHPGDIPGQRVAYPAIRRRPGSAPPGIPTLIENLIPDAHSLFIFPFHGSRIPFALRPCVAGRWQAGGGAALLRWPACVRTSALLSGGRAPLSAQRRAAHSSHSSTRQSVAASLPGFCVTRG